MNERLFITIPGSLAFWFLVVLIASLSLNREVAKAITGRQNITVHISSAEAKPAAPKITEPVKPEVKKPDIHPIKPVKKIEPVKPRAEEKPKENIETRFSPSQELSEAKTGNHGPTIIYQILPKIPDDLRYEAYSAQATARFHIAADGSQTAELLVPSQNPRLNRILLETLKTWKFEPATDNGRKIDSAFDIRVKFKVE